MEIFPKYKTERIIVLSESYSILLVNMSKDHQRAALPHLCRRTLHPGAPPLEATSWAALPPDDTWRWAGESRQYTADELGKLGGKHLKIKSIKIGNI